MSEEKPKVPMDRPIGQHRIPLRPFGRSTTQVSILGLGGHHLGEAADQRTAIQIVHEALDGGITFFDNCWEYHRGKSELWMGAGLKGRRHQVFLMSKGCTHGREGALALQILDTTSGWLHRSRSLHA
jgi:aryl-alcohol dehydrogenase-like predicted oxidoreductase